MEPFRLFKSAPRLLKPLSRIPQLLQRRSAVSSGCSFTKPPSCFCSVAARTASLATSAAILFASALLAPSVSATRLATSASIMGFRSSPSPPRARPAPSPTIELGLSPSWQTTLVFDRNTDQKPLILLGLKSTASHRRSNTSPLRKRLQNLYNCGYVTKKGQSAEKVQISCQTLRKGELELPDACLTAELILTGTPPRD